jgi:O-antigen/teichoic acid export membrane protein
MAAFPALARRAQHGPEAIAGALRRTSKYQFVVTLPLMAGLFLLSDRVIPLLFHGADFARAGFALRLMSLGLAFIFINLMSRYVLAAIDAQNTYLHAVIAGLVANLVLGTLLIPRYGFAGACIAQLAGEISILVMAQRALSRYVSPAEMAGLAARPLVAALGMAAIVWALRGQNLALVITAGGVSYVLLLIAVRAFTPEELGLMRGILSSFRTPGHASAGPGGRS